MSASFPLSERLGSANAPSAAWVAAAAVAALGLALQLRFGMMADVAWLVDCDERWLDGAVPYRDFLEINPPASLLLYLPAVAAARALGIASETAVVGFGFLAAACALALSAAILRRGPPVGASVAIASIVALVVLPGQTFGERDHLAAIFGLPLLAMALARGEGLRVAPSLAALAGLGAGAMAAIKPPYALIGLLLAAYVARRAGWRAAAQAPEYYAASVVGLAYIGCVAPLFPVYVANVLPLGVDIYVPARETLAALVASPGALLALLIGATATLAAGGRYSAGFVVAALGLAGAGVAYFLQGKGWVYQAVPAMMFATLAGGFALDGRRGAGIWAVAALSAGAAVGLLHSLGLAFVAGLAAGFAVEAALSRAIRVEAPKIGALALAAAVGAACGVCVIERPLTPALESALIQLGPGVRLGAISEDMGLPFPLARRVGARWVLHSNSLFVAAAARRILAQRPGDAALRARLQGYAEAERKDLIDDIVASRPDALLVGPLNTPVHDEIWADPRMRAAMAGYRKFAAESRPGYAAELWLAKDFRPER